MAAFIEAETVLVQRPGGVDRHNDPIDGSEHDLTGVVVYDARSAESPAGTTIDTDLVLLGDYGADLRAEDTVYRRRVIDGTLEVDRDRPLRVDGDVQHLKNPFTGHEHGCQAFLKYSAGGTQ